MSTEPKTLAQALYRTLAKAPETSHAHIVRAFITLMEEKRLLRHANRIVKTFAAYAREQERRGKFVAEVGHPINLSGVETIHNAALIAGARVRRGDRVVDTSVRGRLDQLRKRLKPNA